MKKYFIVALLLGIISNILAQSPQGISYQAIVRDSSGYILKNTSLKLRFSIRDSIANGNIVYQETHNDTTDALGLFDLVIGNGTPTSGTFAGINWGSYKKYLQVDFDANVGSYTNLGTQQMMSVPYALYADVSKSISIDNKNKSSILVGAIDKYGNILRGKGFSVSMGNRDYKILFNDTFNIKPIVSTGIYSVGTGNSNSFICRIKEITNTYIVLEAGTNSNSGSSGYFDPTSNIFDEINFIIIGER